MSKRILIFILFLILILVLRLFLFFSQKTQYKDGQKLDFETTIFSEPKFMQNYQSFAINLPTGELVFVEVAGYPQYVYGDKVSISGNLNKRVLNSGRSIFALNFPKIELVKNRENVFLAVVNSIRQKIVKSYQNTLPKDLSALLLGIVFGIKENFSNDFLQNLRTAGVMHVIAASGMNVTMVSGFLFYLFSLVFKRQTAIIVCVLGIVFYDFLAGFQPSIIRASIMAALAFSSQILGKQRDGIYILFLTGFLMLFIRPNFLTDIGFQLSFVSTLGILTIPGLFKKWQNAFSADLLTTFSAQIATLPILLVNFGTYSLWSIAVNVLILWTVPILMILGGFAALSLFIFEPLAKLFLYLSLPLLSYFELVINFFAGFKGLLVFQDIPWQFITAYYLLLSSILVFAFKKRHD